MSRTLASVVSVQPGIAICSLLVVALLELDSRPCSAKAKSVGLNWYGNENGLSLFCRSFEMEFVCDGRGGVIVSGSLLDDSVSSPTR